MPLNPDSLRVQLSAWIGEHGKPSRWVVGFSGGRDSTVLLSLLVELAESFGVRLLAAHVNHGLHNSADDWQAHCEQQAAALAVEFMPIRVEVARSGADGPEGNARVARYRALEALLDDGDWLMTAHHSDDQAETVLLNLMRGSGVAGLRGIAACRPLGRGLLMRPLLDVTVDDVTDYARRHNLKWIEDTSNSDTAFDRNYLRAHVLPALAGRWPAASRQLVRSAGLAAEAADLMDELAQIDIVACGSAECLSVDALVTLPASRCRNLIRHACRTLGLRPPPARKLAAILSDVLPARDDATPHVSWTSAEARRYRDSLYLMPELTELPALATGRLTPDEPLDLDAGLGQLRLVPGTGGGIAPRIAESGLELRFRQGGETLQPAGRGTNKALKKLLQEQGVLPWMRDRLPLLYADDVLVAVADLWVAEAYFVADGYSVAWKPKPAVL